MATSDLHQPCPTAAAKREALRREWIDRIPRWYSPWLHVGSLAALGIGSSAVAIAHMHELRPWQLLFVPLIYVVSNAAEWRAHRDPMHRPRPWARALYVHHTLEHHRLYVTQDMEIRSSRELRLVLVPPLAIVGITVATLPFAAALWLAGQPNLSMLFIVTTQLYLMSYGWLHASYHLPRSSPLGRTRLIRKLAVHHALHHAPTRMSRWNFNVTAPLWDWVRGTVYRGDDISQLFSPADGR
jgi:Fatty acid hydroxylase superfamily